MIKLIRYVDNEITLVNAADIVKVKKDVRNTSLVVLRSGTPTEHVLESVSEIEALINSESAAAAAGVAAFSVAGQNFASASLLDQLNVRVSAIEQGSTVAKAMSLSKENPARLSSVFWP